MTITFYIIILNSSILTSHTSNLHLTCYCYESYMLSTSHDDFVSVFGQIYFQELSCSKPELKLSSSSCSPVIDPHLSPDGTMIAYVRDYELHVLNLLTNEQRQLTHGANGNTVVIFNLPISARRGYLLS